MKENYIAKGYDCEDIYAPICGAQQPTALGSQVTVMSANEKKLQKKVNKLQKKYKNDGEPKELSVLKYFVS